MYFTKTSIGETHIRENTMCQDFSASYHDEERTIVTACDGHGGAVYIRSGKGAKFASAAAINILRNVDHKTFFRHRRNEVTDQIRLQLLCEWNAMVERDLSSHPFRKSEMKDLTDEQRFDLRQDPVKAYGTTLQAAMLYGNKLVCISIGDGGCFLLRKGRTLPAFDGEDDEQIANLTHSMCQENAGRHMSVEAFDANHYDGVLLCTDGVLNPYQNLANFERSLALPAIEKILLREEQELADFITRLGASVGVGDDVTLSVILKNIDQRRYRAEGSSCQ